MMSVSPELVTLYWRDIPLQVNAQLGRTRFSQELPRRFQRAIETASKHLPSALAASKIDWRAESRKCTADLELEVSTQVSRLDAEYGADRLRRLIENQGRDSRTRPR